MNILIIILIGIALLFLVTRCSKRDNFSGAAGVQCPYYAPWPPANDCGAWVDYMSAGYPTTYERGNQAAAMTMDDEWGRVCTPSQMNQLQYNSWAFYDQAGMGIPLDVATAVYGVETVLDKNELCNVAKLITTPPTNVCQLDYWKNSYMSTLTPEIQAKLNLWKTYGC
jgi:hypothetical protein